MSVVRPPAVAGKFYPDNPRVLRSAVHDYLAGAPRYDVRPKAIIGPHAGYVYSGPVAGSAYAQLADLRETIQRVVLLGPSHFAAFQGIAASGADFFATPLGAVPVDRALIARLLELPQVHLLDEAHEREHSLEVHLPFLQEVLGEFSVAPLLVGRASCEQVAEVIDAAWGGPETLLVISSDLSHYHDASTARRLDRETSQLIEQFRAAELRGDRCCGHLPIAGLLQIAQRRGLRVRTVDLRNSGDTAGSSDRVVGYGAYVLTTDSVETEQSSAEQEDACADEDLPLGEGERAALFEVAFRSIEHGISYGRALEVDPLLYPPPLRALRATFVTLTMGGKLRGCMGSLQATEELVANVARNAYSSAFLDPRFAPLTLAEFDQVRAGLSILGPPRPLAFASEADLLEQIRPGRDGLILTEGRRRGTLLPVVWEHIPDRRQFLQALKKKAGLPPDYWSDTVRVLRYGARCYAMDDGA